MPGALQQQSFAGIIRKHADWRNSVLTLFSRSDAAFVSFKRYLQPTYRYKKWSERLMTTDSEQRQTGFAFGSQNGKLIVESNQIPYNLLFELREMTSLIVGNTDGQVHRG